MIIDPAEQSYLLREITSDDLSEVLEEEIITQGEFGSNCRLAYVEFDDGDYTNDETIEVPDRSRGLDVRRQGRLSR